MPKVAFFARKTKRRREARNIALRHGVPYDALRARPLRLARWQTHFFEAVE
jgi:hypothetical protein